MALTFYLGSGSPFAWRVWLALEHKRIPYEPKLLSFSKRETRTPEYLAINPRGKVPAIVDDGFALYESAAILEYLDERYASEPWLFPRSLRERALCRRMVRELDDVLALGSEQLASQLYFRKPDDWDHALIERGRAAHLEEFAFWESHIEHAFLFGDAPSAADFALYPLLATCRRFDLRKPDIALCEAMGPRLRAFMQRIEALPYFDKTYPPHWR